MLSCNMIPTILSPNTSAQASIDGQLFPASLHSPPDSFQMRRRSSFSWKKHPPSISAVDTFTLSPGTGHERYMVVPPFLSPVDTPVDGSPTSSESLESHMRKNYAKLQQFQSQTQGDSNLATVGDAASGGDFPKSCESEDPTIDCTNGDGCIHTAYGNVVDEDNSCRGSVERTLLSAVMPNESSSRSRKTTQSLRLFKQNAVEDRDRINKEERTREKDRERNRMKDKTQEWSHSLPMSQSRILGIILFPLFDCALIWPTFNLKLAFKGLFAYEPLLFSLQPINLWALILLQLSLRVRTCLNRYGPNQA